jgi:hypothetical protein
MTILADENLNFSGNFKNFPIIYKLLIFAPTLWVVRA